jgi:hypothetical protein
LIIDNNFLAKAKQCNLMKALINRNLATELITLKREELRCLNAVNSTHSRDSKQFAITLDLQAKIDLLTNMLKQPNFEELFRIRCRNRALDNADICLSLTEAPTNPTNDLYISLALLFELINFNELLQILQPQLTHNLTHEGSLSATSPTRTNSIFLSLQLKTLSSWNDSTPTNKTAYVERFKDLIIVAALC